MTTTDSTPSSVKGLERRWRASTRDCLIVAFHGHKGGQGSTLLCAHVAAELLLSKRESGRPLRILAIDQDWTSPGLTYMLRESVLEAAVSPEQVAFKAPEITTNEALLRLDDAVDSSGKLLERFAATQGAPPLDDADDWCKELHGILEDIPNRVGQVTMGSKGGETDIDNRATLYFIPALRISDLEKAAQAFETEERLLGPRTVPKAIRGAFKEAFEKDRVFAWLQRAFLYYLIRALDLDFVLIDSQTGLKPASWYTAGVAADMVWLPCKPYRQVMHGTATLERLLKAARDGKDTPLPFGPLRSEIVLSGVPAGAGVTRDSLAMAELGASYLLPHVAEFTAGECYAHSLLPGSEATAYLTQVRKIVAACHACRRQKQESVE